MEGGSQADSGSPGGGRAQSPAVLGSLWGAAPKRAQPLVWGQVGMWSQASHRSPCVRRHGPSVLGKQQKGGSTGHSGLPWRDSVLEGFRRTLPTGSQSCHGGHVVSRQR